jgi:hypothetical protein
MKNLIAILVCYIFQSVLPLFDAFVASPKFPMFEYIGPIIAEPIQIKTPPSITVVAGLITPITF